MSLFDAPAEASILAELVKLDVYNMTPMQAMNVLVELKQNYKKESHSCICGGIFSITFYGPKLIDVVRFFSL